MNTTGWVLSRIVLWLTAIYTFAMFVDPTTPDDLAWPFFFIAVGATIVAVASEVLSREER